MKLVFESDIPDYKSLPKEEKTEIRKSASKQLPRAYHALRHLTAICIIAAVAIILNKYFSVLSRNHTLIIAVSFGALTSSITSGILNITLINPIILEIMNENKPNQGMDPTESGS